MGKGKIVSIVSYRGGTGKSNISANISACLMKQNMKIAVLDTDLKSPGVHLLFGLDQSNINMTLVDFLWNKCTIEDTVYDVTNQVAPQSKGKCWLVPASLSTKAISRLIAEGYDINNLNSHFDNLISHLDLDYLIIDTHPGLNEESMMATAIADILIMIIRPDQQDFYGSALIAEIIKKLEVPNVYIIANKVTSTVDKEDLKQHMKDTFGFDTIGLIPLSEEFAQLGSKNLFLLTNPNHDISDTFESIARTIIETD